MKVEKQWYIAYTHPKSERKLSSLLSKKKIENFCPLNKRSKPYGSSKTKVIVEPLLSRYLFVRVSKHEIETVRQTEGFFSFIYWLAVEVVVSDEEVKMLRQFADGQHNIRLEKIEIRTDESMKVVHSASMNSGNVVDMKRNVVKILVPSIGYSFSADLQASKVHVIDRPVLSPIFSNSQKVAGT